MKAVGVRADMDALLMKEENSSIDYASVTECSHSCGHDGHIAAALACLEVVWKS